MYRLLTYLRKWIEDGRWEDDTSNLACPRHIGFRIGDCNFESQKLAKRYCIEQGLNQKQIRLIYYYDNIQKFWEFPTLI